MNIPSPNQPISLFAWVGHQNVGDELSPYLIEKLTGIHPHIEQEAASKLIAIGSLIYKQTLCSDSLFWGTGILSEEFCNFGLKFKPFPFSSAWGYIKTHYLISPKIFYALRGKLTRETLIKMGFSQDKMTNVLSDPAILTPYFYTPQPVAQHYDLGIICHLSQPIDNLQKLVEEKFSQKVRVISVLREGSEQIEQFLDEVCSCNKIASTSLHGIILAQAYGVPAIYLQDMCNVLQKNCVFKFNDYFLGTNQSPQDPVQFSDFADLIPKLLNMPFPEPPKFRQLCQNLLDVFPMQDHLKIKFLPY